MTATRDGAAFDLGGRRQRAVLAALIVMRNQLVPLDRLAACVWGDSAPANPAGAIQAYVSHLRRRLEPEAGARHRDGVIASTGAGYILRMEPDGVDAWMLERAVDEAADLPPADAARTLEGALQLWRGPPYAEYTSEPWVEAEIVRLTELHAVARERLLAARLALKDAAPLVGELEALVAEDPLREERWRLLVLALYRAQRQADAFDALRRARATLADELGVDPGPALRRLEAEVLAQSPTLDRPTTATTPEWPDRSPSPDHSTPPVDLVDRATEMAVLRLAVRAVAAGDSACVLIEGPAGIGKTRLLAEASRTAATEGLRVLSARGSALEQAFGFGVVRQLFERSVNGAGQRDPLLSGAASGAAAVFDDVGDEPPVQHGSFAVLHALYWLAVNTSSQGPTVICVDDVQWCDTASLRFLAYLVKRLEGLPLLVLLARRSDERHPDDAPLAEIAVDPSVTILRPAPLSMEAAGLLVRERLGEGAEAFVAACHRMTSGNPLLLRQLLRALEDEDVRPDVSHVDTVRAVGSRATSALVTMRLRRMPEAATAAARAVAVLGEAADLPTVAALAQLPEEQAAGALDTLSRSEILTHELRPAFVHPLIREAVHDALPAAERALFHERAASLLREHGATDEHVAAHLMVAPRRGDGSTVEVLRAAARTAMGRGAPEAAAIILQRALEEPPPRAQRAAVLVELGMAEILVDGRAGVAHLSEAYELLADEWERARIALVIARTHVFVSPPGIATEFAAAAAAALPPGLDDERQGLLALRRITGFMHGLPEAGYRAGPEPEVSGDGDGARMLAAVLGYERLRDGVDRDRAVELCRFALVGDRLLAVDYGLLWIVAAAVLLLADEDLGDFWDRAMARAHANGGLFTALSVNLWRGYMQWRYGRLDDALQSLEDATEQQNMWGISDATATYAAAFTLGVMVDRGDLRAAEEGLEAARGLPWVGEGGRLLHDAAARLFLEQNRPTAALDELASAGIPEVVNPAWAPWRGLKARALAALGRVDEAALLLDEEVAILRRWGAPSALGSSLRLRGELRGPDGTADLREAVELLAGSRSVLEAARARLELVRSPHVGDAEAVRLLESALDGARACGARSLVRDVVAALSRLGREVDAADAPEGLTSRQRRVAALFAAGLDVDEIAQRLFLARGSVLAVLESTTGVATDSSRTQVGDASLERTDRRNPHEH
ncbi:BTAD domain-containing putative transcriptional regulator [Agromyces neolithicus]|uniref:BTAD domain-containing putative transcriptional regulator n=1 Tax=Agromyces neolithicus TaxID=269420 RepID=UPI0031D51413